MKVHIKRGEAKAERMPIKSGARDSYITKSLVYHENTGIQQFRLGMIELEPGLELGAHVHNCDEVIYFLEGKGIFRVEGKEYEVEPGDSIYVRPNAVHGPHTNTGTTTWRYLYIVGSPMRPATSEDVYLPTGERVKPTVVEGK